MDFGQEFIRQKQNKTRIRPQQHKATNSLKKQTREQRPDTFSQTSPHAMPKAWMKTWTGNSKGMEENLDRKLSADQQTVKCVNVLQFCAVRTAFDQSAARTVPGDGPTWQ